jgi:hypothetical protein
MAIAAMMLGGIGRVIMNVRARPSTAVPGASTS